MLTNLWICLPSQFENSYNSRRVITPDTHLCSKMPRRNVVKLIIRMGMKTFRRQMGTKKKGANCEGRPIYTLPTVLWIFNEHPSTQIEKETTKHKFRRDFFFFFSFFSSFTYLFRKRKLCFSRSLCLLKFVKEIKLNLINCSVLLLFTG